MSFPLTPASPGTLGLDAAALDRLLAQITRHVADGRQSSHRQHRATAAFFF